MRAFVVSKYKGPLQEADVPEPVVGEHDVLVQVQAAGLNLLDEKIRSGEFKQFLPYELPQILGNDVAGTVIGVGAKVRGFELGDEVYARPDKDRIGTFAERIAVAEADLALKPASISLEEAASLPLVALTAWQALVEQGNVQPGQKVLIHAGAGGVGIDRDPARQAPRRHRRHHGQRRQRRLRPRARRGHRHRLPHPGLRTAPRRVRPGAGQPRREEPREVPARAAARRQGDRDRRTARPGVRPRGRPEPGAAPGDRRRSAARSAGRRRSSA